MATNASTVTAERLALSVVDPDLADRLGPRLGGLTIPVARLEIGRWSGPNGSRGLGVLVARGLLAHVTQLDGQRSVVMAWAGDILLPTAPAPAWIGSMRWTVVERAVVGLLDPPFMAA